MGELAGRLFNFRKPVDRRFYFVTGLVLMTGKYMIDALAVYAVTSLQWTPIDYLIPLLQARGEKINAFPLWFSIALIAWTLPFIWIGVSMTFRRAIDAGKSPWVILGFFVPVLNYLVMLWLSVVPTSGEKEYFEETTSSKVARDRLKSALLGVVVSIVIGSIAIGFSVFVVESYGLSVFVLVPFVLGLIATYVFNSADKNSLGESILVAFISLFLLAGTLFLFALEGLLCIAMAFPLAIPIVFFGAILGREIAIRTPSSLLGGLSCLVLFPVFWGAEALSPEPATFKITTAIEISATQQEVWDHVVEFEEIKKEPAWYFQSGIAYPVRARIKGNGVGALRYCEFSTGAFVEPITVWDEPHRLAFDVQKQPASLQEFSFYQNVQAPHVSNSFRSLRGEFRLEPVDEGKTRLEGSTWYQLDIFPYFYWRPISEWLVRKIHMRVLHQIASESEQGYVKKESLN